MMITINNFIFNVGDVVLAKKQIDKRKNLQKKKRYMHSNFFQNVLAQLSVNFSDEKVGKICHDNDDKDDGQGESGDVVGDYVTHAGSRPYDDDD